MFIKCENCSRMYNVPDEKWQRKHPHFFKCVSCGAVFAAPEVERGDTQHQSDVPDLLASFDDKDTRASDVTPLNEIFKQANHEDESINKEESFNRVKSDITNAQDMNAQDAMVFEPVKQKRNVVSKVLIGLVACVITFLCVFCIGYVCFDNEKKAPVLTHAPVAFTDTGPSVVFQNTAFDLTEDRSLIVSGELVNMSEQTKQIPRVMVLLKNDQAVELQREYVMLSQDTIHPKQRINFQVTLEDIHPDSAEIEIKAEVNS